MIKKYKCMWCNYEFEAQVEYKQGKFDARMGRLSRHKSNYSTQVKCPNCGRLIPTWKKELTGNVVGRKHIHLR